ncbi:hypothetical protein YQE_04572, partial [Dendroctonus ponderosae]
MINDRHKCKGTCDVHYISEDSRVHTNLGAMLHLNGKYKEAENSYKKALKLHPDDETTLTNLHRLYGIMT